jgi:t-SNARE complex subunit (syntaxin)
MDRSLEFHQTITGLFSPSHVAPTLSFSFPIASLFVQRAKQISHALRTFREALQPGGPFDQRTNTAEALSQQAHILKADLEQLKVQLAQLQNTNPNDDNDNENDPVVEEIQLNLQKRLAQAANHLSQRVTTRSAYLKRQQTRTTSRYTSPCPEEAIQLAEEPPLSGESTALLLQQPPALRKRPIAAAASSSIEEVQRTISEIGAMFSELAFLVGQQGETLQRIDEGVSEWAVNCEAAQREIDTLFASVKSDRALLVKFFVVLAAVVVLWAKLIK